MFKMNGEIQAQGAQNEAGEGVYVYCAVNGNAKTDFGKIGIMGNMVYTVVYKDVAAVVHDCSAKPYETKDEEQAKEWVLAHQCVIDLATKKFGTVIPFTFDTVFKGDAEVVRSWLEKEYARIKSNLEKLKDKSEYTIQIFWDDDLIKQMIEEKNQEIKKLKEGMKTRPKGVAYMLGQKLERAMKNGLASESEKYFDTFYNELIGCLDGAKVENVKKEVPEKWKDKRMILNLTCLVHKDKVEWLGDILGEINKREGFSVRFTGPWAPFSFAGLDGDSNGR